jgi:hypothetical protein
VLHTIGEDDKVRETCDLNMDLWDKFDFEVEEVLNLNSPCNFSYKKVGRRDPAGNANGSTLFLKCITDPNTEWSFKIDMNIRNFSSFALASENIFQNFFGVFACEQPPGGVKSDFLFAPQYKENTYTLPRLDIAINTCDSLYMLCDKISAFCAKAVFKRPKDLYDIAMIVSSVDIVLDDLLDAWDKSGSVKAVPVMGFDFTKTGDIKKSYEKFMVEFIKPPFEPIF